jgi:hypothetical protein
MREWFAYGGVVRLKAGDRLESRQDKNRAFERLVLASAPKGVLPANGGYHLSNVEQ